MNIPENMKMERTVAVCAVCGQGLTEAQAAAHWHDPEDIAEKERMRDDLHSEEVISGMCDSLMNKIKQCYAMNRGLSESKMGRQAFEDACRSRELAMVQTKLDEVRLWANEALSIARKK